MSKPVTRVGIAIVLKGKFVLVGTRASGQDLEGFAEFPGGKCLSEELPKETVTRECLEETGLVVRALKEYEIVRHDYDHANVELHFWICEVEGGTKDEILKGNFQWVAIKDLAELKFPEANAIVLKKLTNPE